MDLDLEQEQTISPSDTNEITSKISGTNKSKNKSSEKDTSANSKRRCVSTACIACRRRKSKCDGNLPKCAACASVYLTECEYAPHTDHRRKGVYKKDVDNNKTKNSTLQTLIHAILNYDEDEAFDLVKQIRSCDNLEELAQSVENREKGIDIGSPDSPIYGNGDTQVAQFEAELSGRMGDLVLDGSVKFIGGTSNLIWLNDPELASAASPLADTQNAVKPNKEAVLSWTTVTRDKDLLLHFINMYFCWHYAYFTTLSKELFYRDFLTGVSSQYCSPLLVNVMLALGCHFSSKAAARADPDDSATTGDHFFAEADRLLHEHDEFGTPKLCTVQALALMSVREAGCGRESRGWVYSGMSFRMASDLGLNVDAESVNNATKLADEEIDARRITFWGCFFFDKCWSNYLGRQPQLLSANINARKPEVFPFEDAELWSPYTDSGMVHAHTQPARTRTIALENFKLGEISSDLLSAFYQPQQLDKTYSKQAELKKLSDIHTRLEAWKKDLPIELDPKEGQLPQVLLMHMFYQLLYIHLYRPFLRYTKATSPLPAHISPRKFCTQAAAAISKLFRLYKRTHGLRQICNIAVYIAHSACTIHLLNLPDKNARRDIVHGVKQLEEIGECWTCARRTLTILGLCAEKWKIDLPEEAYTSFNRAKKRWGSVSAPSSTVPPEISTGITQHIQSQPIADTMAENMKTQYREQQMAQIRQQMQQQGPLQPQQLMKSPQKSISTSSNTKMPSPDNMHKRVVTQLALPPQGNMNTISSSTRLKPLAQLTKAQQDAWNAHQARMTNLNNGVGRTTSNEAQSSAAVLFGGVDTLIEDSQDWWYNDQSQLALGFDNWNSPATSEWSTAGTTNMAMNNDTLTTPVMSSPQYYTSDLSQNGYQGNPTGNIASNTFPTSQHHQQQRIQRKMQQQQQQQQGGDSIDGISLGHPLQPGIIPGGQKRINPFDDDIFYQ